MNNHYHVTIKSSNAKTGPIPVTTTSMDSCPNACPMKGSSACYANNGPVGLHWRAVSARTRGVDLRGLCDTIAALPEGQLWRHNQAGDLPGDGENIDVESLRDIVAANKGKRGFTYTHYCPTVKGNCDAIDYANRSGFTVNLSGNNLEHADRLVALGIAPVVAMVEPDSPLSGVTPAGNRFVVCPAESRDGVSCATCQMCQRQRDVIVAFPAHGTGKRRTIEIIRAA